MNKVLDLGCATADVRLGLVQFKPQLKNKDYNLNKAFELINNLANNQLDLVILPEMCNVGYVFSSQAEIDNYAEPPTGKTYQFFSAIAKNFKLYIVYGYPEVSNSRYYNSQNLIGPNGDLLCTYRKHNLFVLDKLWASGGNTGYISFSTPIGNIGLGICMDLNIASFRAYHKYVKSSVVAISSCWMSGREDSLLYWLSLWKDFKGTVMISNIYGIENNVRFFGNSCMIQNNEIVAHCSSDQDQAIAKKLVLYREI